MYGIKNTRVILMRLFSAAAKVGCEQFKAPHALITINKYPY